MAGIVTSRGPDVADGEIGDSEAGGAENGDGAGEYGETRRRRSRRGGRRTREGRARHVEEAEGSADTQPRFGDEDGAPSEVPLAALGEVATLGEAEPASAAPAHAPVAAPAVAPDVPPGHAEEIAAAQPLAASATAEPGREPVPASIEAVAAGVPEAAETPEQAADPTPDPEHGTEWDAATEARAPRRHEPVSSELDPARPKRSGWWSRAKATLGG